LQHQAFKVGEEILITKKTDSPRVIFLQEEEKLVSAFICADNVIQMKIDNPTASKCTLCLLGSYYVWDSHYPAKYKTVLEFFDYKLWNKTIYNNQKLSKFVTLFKVI